MEYSQSKIIIPEYGKNVQHMVEHALTIEDKAERTRCVRAIMQTMGNLFPYLRDEESRHKMYDHLAIMSDFQLDVDSPYDKPEREKMRLLPERLQRDETNISFRHYGRLISQLVCVACEEQDEQKRQQLINLIASRMHLNFQLWNKDTMDASHMEHIKEDIATLSDGRLSCDFEDFHISVRQDNNQGFYKKKKKK